MVSPSLIIIILVVLSFIIVIHTDLTDVSVLLTTPSKKVICLVINVVVKDSAEVLKVDHAILISVSHFHEDFLFVWLNLSKL